MTCKQARSLVDEVDRGHVTYSLALRRLTPDRTEVGAESTFALRVVDAIRNGTPRDDFYRGEAYKLVSSFVPEEHG